MSPRQPPESPDDDTQRPLPQPAQDALDDTAALTDPAGEDGVPEARQAEPADETAVEIDRIAAYLKGPTAFTA